MIRYEDDCVGCRDVGLPCRGSACKYRNVPHYYCDRCGSEDELREIMGRHLCKDCAEDLDIDWYHYPTVE